VNVKAQSLSIKSPIVPDKGLGGIELRTRLIDIQELFVGLGDRLPGSTCLVNTFEARYRFGSGEIEVGVDVRNGKVFKLTAGDGYEGMLLGRVFVGMKAGDAMELLPDLFYSEAEEGLLLRGRPGVFIEVADNDPPPALVPSLRIATISVYIHELDSVEGQKGYW
jgi:hypothetical protein